MRNKKGSYALFERKIFYTFIVIGIICVSVVIFLRSSVRGMLGNAIVWLMQMIFRLTWEQALFRYEILIRRNMTAIIIGLIGLLLVLAFRFLLRWITRYFDEINGGLDILIGQDKDEVHLSDEMWVMEEKMNQCKDILRKRETEARLAEKRKNDLVVYLAHDVRTPLTSVIGYLDLLAQHPDLSAQDRQRYIDLTADKAAHLEELIQEMFEVTKYNLQEIKLNYRSCNLIYMLEQMAEEFYPQLLKKQQRIEIRSNEQLIIEADPEKLARVFHNILKNAIAYGYPDSVIEIQIEKRVREVMLSFRNEGAHIGQEELNRLFDKFYRMDQARSAETGNSGLGLAIAKEIIEAHQGKINAVSEGDQVEFQVCLPCST